MSKGAFTDKVQLHLNSVVGVLLRHNHVEIRTLGANLLATFIKVQVITCTSFVYTSCPNTYHCCAAFCLLHKMIPHSKAEIIWLRTACLNLVFTMDQQSEF